MLSFSMVFFLSNLSTFRSFVGAIDADGGGDAAEDVMGGLQKTFSVLSWCKEAAKVCCKQHLINTRSVCCIVMKVAPMRFT